MLFLSLIKNLLINSVYVRSLVMTNLHSLQFVCSFSIPSLFFVCSAFFFFFLLLWTVINIFCATLYLALTNTEV